MSVLFGTANLAIRQWLEFLALDVMDYLSAVRPKGKDLPSICPLVAAATATCLGKTSSLLGLLSDITAEDFDSSKMQMMGGEPMVVH